MAEVRINAVKFGKLILAFQQKGMSLDGYDVADIHELLLKAVPEAPKTTTDNVYETLSANTRAPLLPAEYTSGHLGEFLVAMAQGRKFEAIKALRAITGLGLKEVKDRIEYLDAQFNIRFR
jgi:ribosomal protein L7/L12